MGGRKREYDIDDRDPVPPTSSDLIIGARDQNGITAFGGVEIGEILIFDSALSDAEVSQMQGHLAHKWGLTSSMANEHPYKNSPPLFENRPEITLQPRYTYFLSIRSPGQSSDHHEPSCRCVCSDGFTPDWS